MPGSAPAGSSGPETRALWDPRRAGITILIASLCVAALIAIVAIASGGDINDTTAKILGSVAALSVYTLAGLACGSLGARRPEVALLGNAGVLVAGIGFAITVVAIWTGLEEGDDTAWKEISISLIVSLGLSHVCLLLRRSPREHGSAGALVRVAAMALTVLLVVLLIVEIAGDDETVGARPIAVVAVLAVLGTLLVPLMGLLERLGQRR